MSIFAICGLTGEGKTYAMTRMGLEALEHAKQGVELYACYHINYPPQQHRIHYFNTMRELVDLENAIVLIDEGSVWFNNRQWQKLDPRVQYKFLQHRKDGLRIYVTSQFFDGMDKIVMRNVHKYFEVKKYLGSDEQAEKVHGLIRLIEFAPRLHDKIRRRPLGSKWFLLRKKYVEYYNTYEKVSPVKKISAFTRRETQEAKEYSQGLQERMEEQETLKKKRGRPRKVPIFAA